MTRTPEQKQALDDVLRRGVSDADSDMMRLCLEKGATPDLMIESLARGGSLSKTDAGLIELALKKGADPDLLLFAGIKERSLAVVKIAMEQGGANANAAHKSPGSNAIYTAADWSYEQHNPQVSDYLVSKGMDVNTRNSRGETPLLRAVIDENYSKVMHYLGHGADPMIADSAGHFPLNVLQHENYGYGSSFDEKRNEMLKAMLKNVTDDSAPPQPKEAFNTVSTDEAIEVSRPIELRKKPESQPGHPAKGFQL